MIIVQGNFIYIIATTSDLILNHRFPHISLIYLDVNLIGVTGFVAVYDFIRRKPHRGLAVDTDSCEGMVHFKKNTLYEIDSLQSTF